MSGLSALCQTRQRIDKFKSRAEAYTLTLIFCRRGTPICRSQEDKTGSVL